MTGQFTYTYDVANRLTALTYPNGASMTYAEDADNRLVGLTETVGSNTLLADDFSYSKPDGSMGSQRMAEARLDNGVASTWAYTYDADARLTGASLTLPAGPSATLGNTSVGGTLDDSDSNSMSASRFVTGAQGGHVASLAAYVGPIDPDPAHDQYSVAIYGDANGSPGALLAASITGTLQANAWNTLPLSVDLAPNTAYWLVYNTDGTSGGYNDLYYDDTGTGAYAGQAFGSWPPSYGAAATGDWNYSLYATFATGAISYGYGYDAVGNMTNNNGTAQRYDADNQIVAAGPITYTFDADGNQTATSASPLPTWRYDAQNHTVSYQDSISSATYQTNGGRQRGQASVTTGGATTTGTYDSDLLGLASFHETAPLSRTIYYVRGVGGRLLALTDGTTVYYYGLDGHGSVANLTDKSGVVVNTYRYDPYGNSLGKTEAASLPNPWQYESGYYDAESGLYLLGARYYAPQLGRFLQQDPLGGDSQYAYAGSDPCNNSDPTGATTCYHYVSGAEISQRAADLSKAAVAATVAAGYAQNVASESASIGDDEEAVFETALSVILLGIAASDGLGASILAQDPNGTGGYASHGVYVRYENKAFGVFDVGCALGDSQLTPPSHSYIVPDGAPFDGFLPPVNFLGFR